MQPTTTIVAHATALLPSARAIVRLSGPDAWAIATQLFQIDGSASDSQRARLSGCLSLKEGACPAELWNFPAPRSATGEHCVELHLPGSPALVEALVQALCDAGCEPAQAGEFSRRAFLHGRMDLSQAEAVMALVSSAGAASARRANDVLSGSVARDLIAMIAQLEMLCASFEVSFDFDEEAAEQADEERFLAASRNALSKLEALAGPPANARGEQPRVVLAGPANAGKSTLFNALVGEERVAVSPEAGATRDLVGAQIDCAGVALELIDSAGFKAARDAIEGQSLERTRGAASSADLIVWLLASDGDGDQELLSEIKALGEEARSRSLLVRTKLDLQAQPSALAQALAGLPSLGICAPRGEGVPELRNVIAAQLRQLAAPESPALSARAHSLLEEARETLREAVEAMEIGAGLEVTSSLARSALSALRDLSGRGPSGDVLDTVFGNFCIGK